MSRPAGWSKQPYTIEIRPTGASTVSVSGTVSVARSSTPRRPPARRPRRPPARRPRRPPARRPRRPPARRLSSPRHSSTGEAGERGHEGHQRRSPRHHLRETVRGVECLAVRPVRSHDGTLLALRIVASTTGTTSATDDPALAPAGRATASGSWSGPGLPTLWQRPATRSRPSRSPATARPPGSSRAPGIGREGRVANRDRSGPVSRERPPASRPPRCPWSTGGPGDASRLNFAFSSATDKLTIRDATFAPGRRYTVDLRIGVTDAAATPCTPAAGPSPRAAERRWAAGVAVHEWTDVGEHALAVGEGLLSASATLGSTTLKPRVVDQCCPCA